MTAKPIDKVLALLYEQSKLIAVADVSKVCNIDENALHHIITQLEKRDLVYLAGQTYISLNYRTRLQIEQLYREKQTQLSALLP